MFKRSNGKGDEAAGKRSRSENQAIPAQPEEATRHQLDHASH